MKRSKRFSQGLGPGHAAIRSPNPSKPIAPDVPKDTSPGAATQAGAVGAIDTRLRPCCLAT